MIVELVKSWAARGGDVLFTRYLNYPGSPFERLIHWSKPMHSPETDLVPELQPLAGPPSIVFNKPTYSAVDAFERDLTPRLVKDASASHAGQVAHEAGLLVAERFIGKDQLINRADIPGCRQLRAGDSDGAHLHACGLPDEADTLSGS